MMLAVQGLNQYYGGSHTLRDVGFDVRAGACTALLGRNGVGKTTLLQLLGGLREPDTGRVVRVPKTLKTQTARMRPIAIRC